MPYVLVGSQKTRYDLNSLVATMKSGGQGNVYFPNHEDYCFKVLHDPDKFAFQLRIISEILKNSNNPYKQVESISAVPLDLVWDENSKKIIGYTMEKLFGWEELNALITESSSEDVGINLGSAGLILAALSEAVRVVHGQKFVLGDFNPSNVLFKRDRGDRFLIKIIDVDSWSIYRKDDLGIEYASKVLDTQFIYYPEIIRADRDGKTWPNFTFENDWWAFAYISWMVLTKYDPFSTGKTDNYDKEDRILENNPANNAATVDLHPECGPATQALGPKLRLHLDRCLKHIAKRPFPTKLLTDFANNLYRCQKCDLIFHESAMFCPRCTNIP